MISSGTIQEQARRLFNAETKGSGSGRLTSTPVPYNRAGMTESYIQQLFAERIGGKTFGKSTAIYKFEKIKRAKKAALEAHPHGELIDLGVGEPDEMAFPLSVRALSEEIQKPENRGYADNGGPEYRRAAALWMDRVFGVAGLNPGNRDHAQHRE